MTVAGRRQDRATGRTSGGMAGANPHTSHAKAGHRSRAPRTIAFSSSGTHSTRDWFGATWRSRRSGATRGRAGRSGLPSRCVRAPVLARLLLSEWVFHSTHVLPTPLHGTARAAATGRVRRRLRHPRGLEQARAGPVIPLRGSSDPLRTRADNLRLIEMDNPLSDSVARRARCGPQITALRAERARRGSAGRSCLGR
jgi:hypothetical protein